MNFDRIDEYQLEPMDDYMVVRVWDGQRKTSGGIALPTTLKKESKSAAWGEVISVGPGHLNTETGERSPMDYSPGDWVVFNEYSGTSIELSPGGDKLLLLAQRNAFARINAAVPA